MHKLLPIVVVVALVVVGYFIFAQNTAAPVDQTYVGSSPVAYASASPSGAMMDDSKSISLVEQSDSGESGMATFTEKNGKVEVVLSLTGAPVGVVQPAHIHTGSCAEIGGVVYPLTFPVDGKSTTTLSVTMAQLKDQLPLALNVHKSGPESSVYFACGDLDL